MKKLRKGIAPDGTLKNKNICRLFSPPRYRGQNGFNAEGFGLGFLLGFIGIAIAYLAFKDENKQNRIKWAWIGLASAFVLGLIFFLVLVAILVKK